MTTINHPAHGPVSLDRLHQIRETLSKAAAQSDGGNLGYAMTDAVKVIDGAIAVFGAEPVLYAAEETLAYAEMGELHLKCLSQPMGDAVIPLYRHAQPVQVVPVEMNSDKAWGGLKISAEDCQAWSEGWNACRAAMLHGKSDGKPELTVWYGAMPETNGKTNWTAILHRKGQQIWEGITIDRSEYPDRVRYEADRMRHLIGELPDEPDILSYDVDAHSGYVKPDNSPVTPDGWIPVSERMPENKPGSYEYIVFESLNNRAHHDYWNVPDSSCDDFSPFWNHYGKYVTHWMPLPAAPQQEVLP